MEHLPVPSNPALPVAPTLPPPAPTGRDPHPGLVIVLPLLALGLLSSGVTTWFGTGGSGTAAAARLVPVSAVAVADGGHALTVTVPVRCAGPVAATAAESGSRVVVVSARPPAGGCVRAPSRVAVDLRRALGRRTVVDAATGRPLTGAPGP